MSIKQELLNAVLEELLVRPENFTRLDSFTVIHKSSMRVYIDYHYGETKTIPVIFIDGRVVSRDTFIAEEIITAIRRIENNIIDQALKKSLERLYKKSLGTLIWNWLMQ